MCKSGARGRFFPKCDRCLGDVYPEELVHFIDGRIICPDCFFDFAFDYFEDKLVAVKDLPELIRHGV